MISFSLLVALNLFMSYSAISNLSDSNDRISKVCLGGKPLESLPETFAGPTF
jgi:hypothetical protein